VDFDQRKLAAYEPAHRDFTWLDGRKAGGSPNAILRRPAPTAAWIAFRKATCWQQEVR